MKTTVFMGLVIGTIAVTTLMTIVALSTESVYAQLSYNGAAGNNNMTRAQFLFIQGAQSGSVSDVNATTSTLELSDVSDKTILFSDRPDRIVASIDTADFIGNWSTGANSFAVDPPNAALVVDDDVEQRQDLGVIELLNPEYDSVANTLRYDITAENATTTTTSIDLPEFGQSTLVIDDDGNGHYVPGQKPDVTGGVTKPQFQDDDGPPDNGQID